ncbi:hypothetical protein [Nocardioides sp. SYSU DS0663]|uniref:hypothetical protein n=1 Tax=Nocardioides sp. SYSU DS0663 TaxID=3416445 RepID=UPI003F4AFF4A
MTPRRSATLLAPLALGAALLTGCGEDAGTTAADPAASASSPAASEPSEPAGPACTDVWTEGATLPRGYDGCVDAGAWVAMDGRYCEFGKPLVTHERFYAVPGGRIAEAAGELVEDPAYQDVLRKCSG